MEWEIAFILTVLFLLLGFLIAWVTTKLLGITAGPTVAALVFLPVIVTLLFSDRIVELSAFGFEAKLRDVAASEISQDAKDTELSIWPSELHLGSDAPERDLASEAFFGRAGHVVTIMGTPQWETLELEQRIDRAVEVAAVIYNSLLAGGYQALVILDGNKVPIGVFEASFFLDLLRIPLDVPALINKYEKFSASREVVRAQLQQTELWVILSFPAQRAELEGNKAWISSRASRLEVLNTMMDKRYEVMVLTDDRGRYAGVVARSDLVSSLLLNTLSSK